MDACSPAEAGATIAPSTGFSGQTANPARSAKILRPLSHLATESISTPTNNHFVIDCCRAAYATTKQIRVSEKYSRGASLSVRR
jgi:hypothetical protein